LGEASGDGAHIDHTPDVIRAHTEDAAHFAGGHADGVARPRTERDVAHVLTHAARALPVGAQSSLTGGATPDGGVVLTTSRFASIQESGQHHFRVGSGVPLTTLQELLHSGGRWYAPSPTYTGAFAGGVVADRAMGLRMKVLVFDPVMTTERAREIGVKMVGLDELYAKSDFITYHVVIRDTTKGMLNKDAIPGPSGAAWGASTIYGNWRRGTGILNNELYVGRLTWNRLRYVKNPDTGKRVSRLNPTSEWMSRDVPELRIVQA